MVGGREVWEGSEALACEETGMAEGEAGGERGTERGALEREVAVVAEGWAGAEREGGKAPDTVKELSGSCRWSRSPRRRSPCCR